MLLFSILSSILLLIPTIGAAFLSKLKLVPVVSGGMLILLFGGALMGCVLPVVALQSILTLVAYGVWRWMNWTPRRFAYLSIASFLISYGVAGWYADASVRDMEKRFPAVSIEQRLPKLPINDVDVALTPEATKNLADVEKDFEDLESRYPDGLRSMSLQMLHEDTRTVFLSQPGFGVTRMSGVLSSSMYGRARPRHKPESQPGTPVETPWSSGSFTEPAASPRASELQKTLAPLHRRSKLDFLEPSSFGYVRDRSFVVGFEPHEMQQVPDSPAAWELRTVSLIGLVLHPEPVVYESAHLPRMDDLRKMTTVPPDDFEATGLQKLKAGEDLFVHEQGGILRAIGSLRATNQCLQCHGGKRGELLGAFSYHLVSKGFSKKAIP